MAVNSSTSCLGPIHHCSDSVGADITLIVFIVINIFLFLPLSLLVLYLGLQRRRQRGSSSASSHSDVFTFHWAALELVYVLGFSCYFGGKYVGALDLMTVGYYAQSVFHPGQMCVHVLTCVERYLAALHPVTYLKLRRPGGVRIRNVLAACVWLVVCGWIGLSAWYFPGVAYAPVFFMMALTIVLVSFCSLSVLHVLVHPGPGGGRRRETVRSKRRAFHTTAAIMAALWFMFTGLIVCLALDNSNVLTSGDGCLVLMSSNWFTLPSSLVLPLLFLHRAGKRLSCGCSEA